MKFDLHHQSAVIERIEYPHFVEEIERLRQRAWEGVDVVFTPETAHGTWLDTHEATALHWIVRVNGALVASARLHIIERLEETPYYENLHSYLSRLRFPCAYMSRLVVDHMFRGKGLATALDRVRVEQAEQFRCRTIIVVPSPPRVRALSETGFVSQGVLSPSACCPLGGPLMVREL